MRRAGACQAAEAWWSSASAREFADFFGEYRRRWPSFAVKRSLRYIEACFRFVRDVFPKSNLIGPRIRAGRYSVEG